MLPFSTITLSPAIDILLSTDKFPEPGDVLKGFGEVETPGGKGLNLARWLAMRGHPVLAAGLLGLERADLFEQMLGAYGIQDALIRVKGPSRRNVMFTTPGGMFKLNRPAFPNLRSEDWSVSRVLDPCIAHASVCIIAGSLPSSVDSSVYADMIVQLRRAGVSAVLDTSGAALEAGLEASPCVIKPNRYECAELLGSEPKTPEDFTTACLRLLAKCACVIISDGPDGCWFADRTDGGRVFHGTAPLVDVVDTTAAGDALLAEFCHHYFPSTILDETAIRFACAAGAAATTMPGAAAPSLDLVDRLAKEVQIKQRPRLWSLAVPSV